MLDLGQILETRVEHIQDTVGYVNRPNQRKCGLSCISIYPARLLRVEVGRKGPGKNSTASVSLGELGPSPLLLPTAGGPQSRGPSTVLERGNGRSVPDSTSREAEIWPTQSVESCAWGWRGVRRRLPVRSQAGGWYVSLERFWSLPPRQHRPPV